MSFPRALLLAVLLPAPGFAATIVGTDYAGANLTPANGDVLQGTFTNVGKFTVGAGLTVFAAPGLPLAVYASTIDVQGTLSGSGRGKFAGAGGAVGAAGLAGLFALCRKPDLEQDKERLGLDEDAP